jgi:membrane-bound ClpP family serine protease
MLMITIISAVMLIGFLLVILEIFFIPGTTLVGLLGFIFNIAAIVVVYIQYGNETGLIVLIATTIAKLLILLYAFRTKPWMRFSNKQAITSKVNEGLYASIQVGDIGQTLSVLRPIGKALINNIELEVKSIGKYVDTGIAVKVTSVTSHQVIVEPTN